MSQDKKLSETVIAWFESSEGNIYDKLCKFANVKVLDYADVGLKTDVARIVGEHVASLLTKEGDVTYPNHEVTASVGKKLGIFLNTLDVLTVEQTTTVARREINKSKNPFTDINNNFGALNTHVEILAKSIYNEFSSSPSLSVASSASLSAVRSALAKGISDFNNITQETPSKIAHWSSKVDVAAFREKNLDNTNTNESEQKNKLA
jgi:hypothetical protein